MKRPKFEVLAANLAEDLARYKNTIPGLLGLEFSGLETALDNITLHLETEVFIDSFRSVDDIDQLESGNYHVKVKIGDLAIVAVLDQNEIKRYMFAEPSASTQPVPVICRD